MILHHTAMHLRLGLRMSKSPHGLDLEATVLVGRQTFQVAARTSGGRAPAARTSVGRALEGRGRRRWDLFSFELHVHLPRNVHDVDDRDVKLERRLGTHRQGAADGAAHDDGGGGANEDLRPLRVGTAQLAGQF
uniref:Uncharacterized protein n=1 Tax=Mantoniella antarctica TaxID=81844 RepID=A0A7S0XI56_9CHLO